MMKRMLAMLIMAIVLSMTVVSFDMSDADDALPEENVVYGSDYEVIYGGDTFTGSVTVFVIGWEYHDVCFGYGKDPQDALPGMTSYSKEVDGVDMMFMSGTPTDWCGILIPFDVDGCTLYILVESVPIAEYEYGADPTKSGTTYTMELGEYYHFTLGPGTEIDGMDVNTTMTKYGLDIWYEVYAGMPWVRVDGTTNNVGTFTISSNGTTYTFIIEGDPILVTKITVSGEDHIYSSPISFTPTVAPADATNKTMSCYLSSGSSYASINKSSVTSGESVTATGISMGKFTVMFRSESGTGNVYLGWNCWTEQECKAQLSFDANGGTGAPSTMTQSKWTSACSIFGSASFTIPDKTPTRDGYIFKYWGSSSYVAGKTVSIAYSTSKTATKTLTATWEQEIKPTSITLNYATSYTMGTNSTYSFWAMGMPSDASIRTVTADSYDSSLISLSSGTTGGGYTKFTITSNSNVGSTTIKMHADGDPSVTAEFVVTVVQKVTGTCKFMNGNSVFATVTDESLNGTFYYDIPASKPTAAAGKSFVGWCFDATGNGTTYTNDDSNAKSTKSDEVMYAIFQNIYTLKFADTGTTSLSNITSNATSESSYTFTLPATICAGKTGYEFIGWSEVQNDIEASFLPSGTYTVYANTSGNTYTLYGVWAVQTYNVTFVTDGSPASSIEVTYGQAYGNLPTTLRTGYTFDGWYTSVTGGTKVTSSTTVTATADHKLYAHWNANTYTVAFNTGSTYSVPNISVTYGQTYGSASGWPSTDPTKTDYIFTGWWTDAEGGTRITADTIVSATSNHVIYAHWKEKTDCTIDYIDGDNTLQKIAKLGDTIQLEGVSNVEGYTFDGWYTSVTGGTRVGMGGDDYTVEDNVKLYARWIAKTVTVMFNSNGGSYVGSQQATFGQKYGNLPEPSKDGYDFDGWMFDGQIITKDSIVNTMSPVLEAQWVVHVDRFLVTYYKSVQEKVVIGTEKVVTGTKITMTSGIAQTGLKWLKWVTLNGDTVSNFDMDTLITADLDLYGVYSAVEKPTGTLTVTNLDVNGKTYVVVKVASEDSDTILWDFGDGEEAIEHSAGTVNYRYSPGEYTIKITLTNEGGSTVLEETITVSDSGSASVSEGKSTMPMVIIGVVVVAMVALFVVPRVV